MAFSLQGVTEAQKDALQEVANVMIGHAATALARLTRTRIDVEIPQFEFLPWDQGLRAAAAGSSIIAGVRARMLGKLSGDVYVTFPRESAFALADVMRDVPIGSTRYLTSAAAEALVEVGNILAGACLAAFYEFLDLSIIHSVPEFIYDVPDALSTDTPLAASARQPVLLAHVELKAPEINLRGSLILLFSVESMSSLLASLESGVVESSS